MTSRTLFLLAFALWAGCGTPASSPLDAGDPTPDAVDAGPPPVTITSEYGSLETRAFAVGPDGAPGATASFEDGRTATLSVMPGSSVTVYTREQSAVLQNSHLATFFDVQPGDHLVVGEHPQSTGPDALFTASWPGDPTSRVLVFTPCGFALTEVGEDSVSMLLSDCAPTTTDDVVFVREDGAAATAWGIVKDVPLVDGGTVTLRSWNDMSPFVLGAPAAPPGVDEVEVGIVDPYFGNATSRHWWSRDALPASLEVPMPGLRDYYGEAIWVGPEVEQSIGVRLPEGSPTWTPRFEDFPLLPHIADVDVRRAASGGGRITWSRGDGAVAEGTVIQLDRHREEVVDGATAYSDVHWILVVPADATDVTLPPIPDSLGELLLPGDSIRAEVAQVDLRGVGGLAALRALPEWALRFPLSNRTLDIVDAAQVSKAERQISRLP
jgi:hypothetical protein